MPVSHSLKQTSQIPGYSGDIGQRQGYRRHADSGDTFSSLSYESIGEDKEDPTAPLLGGIQNNAREEHQADGVSHNGPLFVLSVMIVSVLSAFRLNSLLMDQYLYQVYSKQVFGNVSVDTSSHPCANASDHNLDMKSQETKVHTVQEMTSGMELYLDFTSYGLGMLSTLILGTVSNLISRKALLVIPCTGYFIRLVTVPVIVHWELDVHWFFIGYAVDGLCGNIVGILLGTYLYTTDVTPRNRKRTVGVAIVEATKGAVGGAFYAATGQLIEKTGFMIPALTSAGLQLIAILIACALPNRKPVTVCKASQDMKSVRGLMRHMFSPFTAPKEQRVRRMVALGSASFCITLVARAGLERVVSLYIMNLPFCFDAITIGWYLTARDVSQHVFSVLSIVFCLRFLPSMGFAILGSLSSIASCFMYAFAKNDLHIYLAPVIGLAQNMPYAIIRGEVSRLMGPEYQGPFFASLAFLESLAITASAPILLSTYKATQDLFTGLAFLVASAILFVVVILTIIYQVIWHRHIRQLQRHTLHVDVPTDDGRQ